MISIFVLGIYIYTSLVLSKIAEKLGNTDTWRAWIPIVKGAYQLELGGYSPWYYLLIFIPFLGWIAVTVLSAVAWVRISELRGFPTWVGLIVALAWLIPNGGMIAQFIAQGYIAWGEYQKK
ncbi:hypothetical protein CVU76_01580 [Candidatus Dojkabacteria bacterium HGW-Dojkabacteria-1]|uniref:Signal peptidase I n=1 Tax=Candidatus Dojkabacteria bacterium HGW-Dojkabacteria-1 TaxID=2013761 RepID=A0A2N2F3G8_9BACT|nr:MAG: hypothetical protein CVU76_01580 [Candidatus Dojkabacteria bacterium HGW-Dojkabacteria-1]